MNPPLLYFREDLILTNFWQGPTTKKRPFPGLPFIRSESAKPPFLLPSADLRTERTGELLLATSHPVLGSVRGNDLGVPRAFQIGDGNGQEGG